MNILFSINYKFFGVNPNEFINKILENDKTKAVKGFEACFDFNKQQEREYIHELAYLCLKNDYILQFHGDSSYDINIQKEYFDFISSIANILNKRINIVFHPLYDDNIENSIKNSNIYFSEILNYIYEKNYNINISIENLNSIAGPRLGKDYLKSIVGNNTDLNFTYDVGHEISEYGELTDLDDLLKNRLTNVHIHTFYNNIDHMPIGVNDFNKEKWVKALSYLKLINFAKTLVLEYDFYQLGSNYDERLLNYIKCSQYISEYL